MSNLELTREFWRLWRHESLGELLSRYEEFFTEDLEWRSPIVEMKGTAYIGKGGLARHFADLRDTFDEIHAHLLEMSEIAPDVVCSRVRMHGRGSTSGATVDAPLVAIARVRDGRMCWAWGSFDVEAGERLAEAMAHGEDVDALLPDTGKKASRTGSDSA